MTNSQSVEHDGIVAGNISAMLDNANRGVNRMQFISLRIHLDYKFNLRLRNFIINSSILDTSLRYGMVSPTQVGGNFYTN